MRWITRENIKADRRGTDEIREGATVNVQPAKPG